MLHRVLSHSARNAAPLQSARFTSRRVNITVSTPASPVAVPSCPASTKPPLHSVHLCLSLPTTTVRKANCSPNTFPSFIAAYSSFTRTFASSVTSYACSRRHNPAASAMSAPEAKRQRTQPTYELLYHPSIPGRGEYIRLVLEAAGALYSDVAKEKGDEGYARVLAASSATSTGDADGNPPAFAPPALRVPGAGRDGKALVISQTPNIVQYLAAKLGLAPADEADALHANQHMLTALDLSNEAHDSHHPIAVSLYYEDQKDAAKQRAKDFRETRIPKFFSYFERTLKGNEDLGQGKYLVGDKLSHADTTLWQVVDGLSFAFPKELEARKSEFPLLFEKFYAGIKEEKGLKEYLASDRRLKYSMGLYRHYPELDRE